MTETNQQELTDLIANTYASEFHDPAGHAARAILQRHAEALLTERKEAFREAADAIDSLDGSRAQGYYASEAHSGYQEAQRDAEAAIRALAEGGAQ